MNRLILSQLYERLGQEEAASRVLRDRFYSWATGPFLLSAFLAAEADLAERSGDGERASRLRTQLEALRRIEP